MAITPVFTCGFECGVLAAHTFTSSGTPSFSTSTVRSGARSLRFNPSSSVAYVVYSTPSSNIMVIRVYIYFTSLPNANTALVSVSGRGAFFKQSDSKIYAGVASGPVFGASGVSVTTGQWYRIDAKINVSANPNLIDVSVNGTTCGQVSFAASPFSVTSFQIGALEINNTSDVYFDDLLVSQTSADYPLGAGYVNHFIPTSDGTHNVAGTNDFEVSASGTDILNSTTNAYQLIDDVPMEGTGSPTDYINLVAPPNATDYAECKYGPAPGIATPTTGPRAVQAVMCYGKGTSQGTNNIRLVINDNGTVNDVFNGDVAGTTPAVTYKTKQYALSPSGAAWNANTTGNGAFNNIRVRCYTSDAAPDPWFISTMIEAEFQQSTGLPHRIRIISKSNGSPKENYTTTTQDLTLQLPTKEKM